MLGKVLNERKAGSSNLNEEKIKVDRKTRRTIEKKALSLVTLKKCSETLFFF